MSDSHHEKHEEPRISTLRGIIIDWNDEYENALDSIRVNREFDSIEIQWNCVCFQTYPPANIQIDPEIHAREMNSLSCSQIIISSLTPSWTTMRRW
jgi:hypothetical protein